MPPTWTVVGWPGNNPAAPTSPVMEYLAGANIDLNIDLMLPPFEGDYYDWNPEWVSLSFYGYGFVVEYEFVDWCVPEPGTILLLGCGGLLFRRRRRA